MELDKDKLDNKYFSEVTDQEFSTVTNIITAILDKDTNGLDERTKGIIEIIPELLKKAKELRHDSKFKNMTFEKFTQTKDFHKILTKSLEDKFPTYTKDSPEIKLLKSIIPATFYVTNNKLSNEMTKEFVNKGTIALSVIKLPKKSEVITYNSLTYDDKNISITGRYEFTAYDRAIHNAVCSLFVAGNDIITPAMVYRIMNGMTETEYVSPQATETVKNSLDKSRFLRLKVNFTEEARARNINVDKAEIDSNLLEARVITVEAGGNKVNAYKIHATPALYQYAQYTKQILSVPLRLLDTKEATRSTEDIIPLKEYLIRRIEIMKHDRTMINKILYDTIFEEIGIAITSRVQKERIRNYIKEILNLWKTRDKYINDFKEYKEKNSIKGIEIFIYQRR